MSSLSFNNKFNGKELRLLVSNGTIFLSEVFVILIIQKSTEYQYVFEYLIHTRNLMNQINNIVFKHFKISGHEKTFLLESLEIIKFIY